MHRLGLANRAGASNAILTTGWRRSTLRSTTAAATATASSGGVLQSASANWLGVGIASTFGGGVHALLVRWATKKAAGSTHNKRDSPGRRLGIKEFGGAWVEPGYIIARQRGTNWHPGMNVSLGRDHTISSLISGHVRFTHTLRPWRHGASKYRTWVSVVPEGQDPAILRAYFDANQSYYLRVLSDKYHSVPRSVRAPRERAIARATDSALAAAIQTDRVRQQFSTLTADGTPQFATPLRANTVVTRVRTAHAILGERKPKPARPIKYARIIASNATSPVPTRAPAAMAAAAAAVPQVASAKA